jgi:hypothetical protein
MPGYDRSWGVDESWETLPPRLESRIQEFARNAEALRGVEKAALSMWSFPQEIRDCIAYMRRFGRVTVPDPKTKEEKQRRPSYQELYMGMWEAGFAEFTSYQVVKDIRARRERVLRSGGQFERAVAFGWTPAHLPFYMQCRRMTVRFLPDHLSQAHDLADDFQTSTSVIGVVVFAAAVTTSDVWLEHDRLLTVPYQDHAQACVRDFLEWSEKRLLG